jgi:hypothetical protein
MEETGEECPVQSKGGEPNGRNFLPKILRPMYIPGKAELHRL